MKTIFAISLLCLATACSTGTQTDTSQAGLDSLIKLNPTKFVGLSLDSVQALNGIPFYLTYTNGFLHVLNWEGGHLGGKSFAVSFTTEPGQPLTAIMLSQELIDKKWNVKIESVLENWQEPTIPSQGYPGDYPFGSYRLISYEDVRDKLISIKFIRNEIFARYGYIFKTPDLRDHFATLPWYKPTYARTEMIKLTDIEKKNIDYLAKLEENIFSDGSFSFDVPASTPTGELTKEIEKTFLETYLARDTSRTATGQLLALNVLSYDSATDKASCVPGYAIMLYDDQKEANDQPTGDYKCYFFMGNNFHYKVWDDPIRIEGPREDDGVNASIDLSYAASATCPVFAIDESSSGIIASYSHLSFFAWSEYKHSLVLLGDFETSSFSQIVRQQHKGEVVFIASPDETGPYDLEYRVSGDSTYTQNYSWYQGTYTLMGNP